jgi:hypothetical protein
MKRHDTTVLKSVRESYDPVHALLLPATSGRLRETRDTEEDKPNNLTTIFTIAGFGIYCLH